MYRRQHVTNPFLILWLLNSLWSLSPMVLWALSMEKQCCLVLYFKSNINILESNSLSDSGFAITISHFADCYINFLLLWKNTWENQKEENVYFSTCIQRFQTMVAWLDCSSDSCTIFHYANRMWWRKFVCFMLTRKQR